MTRRAAPPDGRTGGEERPASRPSLEATATGQPEGVPRRGFLAVVGASVASVVVLWGGQSFDALSPFNVFGPRVKGLGPQGLPVNKTARRAGVTARVADPAWRLTVRGRTRTVAFDRAALEAMPQRSSRLPIACVEGWSSTADWRGVPLQHLLTQVGDGDRAVRVTSLERQGGGYRVMTMGPEFIADERTLVALELNGEVLDPDHGFPARIIAPGRPGVLQTKWISTVEVL